MTLAQFESIYRHGFLRVAIGTPRVALADPNTNARRTIELAQRAVACKAALVVFPELGLSGYSLDDLVLQDALLDGEKRQYTSGCEAVQDTVSRRAPSDVSATVWLEELRRNVR